MKLQALGKNTSKVEILNISPQGIWIYVSGKEYFLKYEDYPWFRDAKISAVYNIDLTSPNHLYWPDLDVDLEVESLGKPESYPLVYS